MGKKSHKLINQVRQDLCQAEVNLDLLCKIVHEAHPKFTATVTFLHDPCFLDLDIPKMLICFLLFFGVLGHGAHEPTPGTEPLYLAVG